MDIKKLSRQKGSWVSLRQACSNKGRYLWLLLFACLSGEINAGELISFSIPQSTADVGIKVYVQQAGRQVLFPFDLVSEYQTNKVTGRLDANKALDLLLRDTGLHAFSDNDNLVIGVVTKKDGNDEMNKKKNFKKSWGVIGAFTAFISSGISAVVAENEQGDQHFGLEEIVVTAQKTESSLQDTPVSVLAFDDETLLDAGISDVNDLQNISPGLTINGGRASGTSEPTFTIRGVGSQPGIGFDRGVGLYVDDIYFSRSHASILQTIGVDRIEVLRGPQGTLFGRNTTGGAIRYITKKPSEEFEGSVKLVAGELNRRNIVANVNVPLSDTLFFRAEAGKLKRDGYIKKGSDDLANVDASVFSGALRFVPNDDFSLDFKIIHSREEDNGSAADIVSNFRTGTTGGGELRQLNNALIGAGQGGIVLDDPRFVLDDYSLPNYCLFDGDGDPLTFLSADQHSAAGLTNTYKGDLCGFKRDRSVTLLSLTADWAISDNLSLKSTTGFIKGDQHAPYPWLYTNVFVGVHDTEFDSWSQEFQLSGIAFNDRLTWLGGLYFFGENGENDRDRWELANPNLDPVIEYSESSKIETKSLGIFGQGTFAVTDTVNLTLGLRYSEDDKEIGYRYFNNNRTSYAAFEGIELKNDNTWDSTDYRISLDWNLTDEIMVFITNSTGFKSGGFNDSLSNSLVIAGATDDGVVTADECNFNCGVTDFLPEELKSWEIGIRAEWFDHRLRTNLTAFSQKIEDFQARDRTQVEVSPGDFQTALIMVNTGEAKMQGLEGDITFAASSALTLGASFSLIDAKITDTGGIGRVFKDQEIHNTPEVSYNLSAKYDHDLQSGARWVFSTNYSYKGEQFSTLTKNTTNGLRDDDNIFAASDVLVDSYGVLSARFAYYSVNDDWNIALSGTNLTDEVYANGATTFSNSRGGMIVDYRAAPRLINLEFTYNF